MKYAFRFKPNAFFQIEAAVVDLNSHIAMQAEAEYLRRRDMQYEGRTRQPNKAADPWTVGKEFMELYKQTETENYQAEPRVSTGPNKRFLVVRYGWYAFSFLLDPEEKRGHTLNQRAIEICKAMLALEGRDEDQLRYTTSTTRHLSATGKPLLPGSTPKGSKGGSSIGE